MTAVVAVVLMAVLVWIAIKPTGPGIGFVSGNGGVEVMEIDIATKLAGRVQGIMANKGDFVKAVQPLPLNH